MTATAPLPACGYDCDGVCILDVDNDGICDCEDECLPAEGSPRIGKNYDYKLIVESTPAVLPQEGQVYRFYVNAMDPTDKISAVFGNDQNPLVINTPDGIYNNVFNSSWNASGINPALLAYSQNSPTTVTPQLV